MRILKMLKTVIFLAQISVSQAMLHQLPATDADMLNIGTKYPAVGIIQAENSSGGPSTGTLIRLPNCSELEGKAVLCSKHALNDWGDPTIKYTFTVEDIERSESTGESVLITKQITRFLPAPILTYSFCGLNLPYFSKERDFGIAILDEAISNITPMALYLDSLQQLPKTEIVTAVGFGFHGRLDLGIKVNIDNKKRGIQFLLEEIKEGRITSINSRGRIKFNNPKYDDYPLYYNKAYDPSFKSTDMLIRGQVYNGDSGGPLIVKKDAINYVAGVIQGCSIKKNDIKFVLNSHIELSQLKDQIYRLENNLSEIDYCNVKEFLEGNCLTVPEEMNKFAIRNFHTNTIAEYFESLVGAKSWFEEYKFLSD